MPTNERHARVTGPDIRHLGELSKSEIRVWLFLRFCRNDRTGRCDPSRAVIGEGTGLLKSHVTEAIDGLGRKGWIIEDETDGFLFPNQEQTRPTKVPESGTKPSNIVPDSGTVPDSGKFPNQEHKVPDLAQKVPDLGTSLNKISLTTKTTKGTRTESAETARDRDKSAIWTFGVKLLTDAGETERNARTFLGGQAKLSNERILAEAIGAAMYTNPVEPKAFIVGAVRARMRSAQVGKSLDDNAAGDVIDFPPPVAMRPAPDLPRKVSGIWANVKATMQKRISPELFRTWFDPIVFDGLDEPGRRFLLRAGDAIRSWVSMYYSDALDDCLSAGGLDGYKIAWEVDNGECTTEQLRAAI